MGMPASQEEAYSLLAKWREEKQLLCFIVNAAAAGEGGAGDIASGVGIIDNLTQDLVHVRTKDELNAERVWLSFPLAGARYTYHHTRELEHEERPPFNYAAIVITLEEKGLSVCLYEVITE